MTEVMDTHEIPWVTVMWLWPLSGTRSINPEFWALVVSQATVELCPGCLDTQQPPRAISWINICINSNYFLQIPWELRHSIFRCNAREGDSLLGQRLPLCDFSVSVLFVVAGFLRCCVRTIQQKNSSMELAVI